jgi:Arc/MetJ family transcription regulator
VGDERRKTTVEIDLTALREAARHLGTSGLKETLDAALRDVIRRADLERGAAWLRDGRDHVAGPARADCGGSADRRGLRDETPADAGRT